MFGNLFSKPTPCLDPKALCDLIGCKDGAQDKLFLLDVRGPAEFATCHIEGSVNIPLDTLPDRLKDIPGDAQVVTICHHGMRSKRAADFLIQKGFKNVASLTGGVDVWATRIDPSMPRY